ncbi:hypothetical protein VPH35_046824 [Triticum aestivum]
MTRKHWTTISPVADCALCPATESISHIILRCRLGGELWGRLGLRDGATGAADISAFVQTIAERNYFGQLWCVLFAACAMALWQSTNDRTFNNKVWSPMVLCHTTVDMLKLWRHRARRQLEKETHASFMG